MGARHNTLKSLCKDNLKKPIFAHLNINCTRNKFDLLSGQIKGNNNIVMISETKIDDSFFVSKFLIFFSVHYIGLILVRKVETFCYMLGKIFVQIQLQ